MIQCYTHGSFILKNKYHVTFYQTTTPISKLYSVNLTFVLDNITSNNPSTNTHKLIKNTGR